MKNKTKTTSLVLLAVLVLLLLCSCGSEEMMGSGEVSFPVPSGSEDPMLPEPEIVYLVSSETKYGEFMRVESTTTFEYDDQQRETTRRVYDSFGELTGGMLTEYDQKGNVTKETHKDELWRTSRTVEYFYNEKGEVLKCNTYNAGGALWYVLSYGYDNFDRKIMTHYADGTGNTLYTIENIYDASGDYVATFQQINGTSKRAECDSNGNIYVQEDFDAEGNLNYRTTYKYNEAKTDRISAVTEYGDGTYEELEYIYDSDGVIQHINYTWMTGEPISRHAYEYDQHGNLLCEKTTNMAGVPAEMTVWEYTAVELDTVFLSIEN